MMDWVLLPLKRYAVFSGRSRRKEYWLFVLFTVIVSMVLSLIDSALGLRFGQSVTGTQQFSTRTGASGVLSGLFSLAVLLPSLAVAVRRLHDTDRSGWWILLPVVPYLVLLVLVFAMRQSPAAMALVSIVFGLVALVAGIAIIVFLAQRGTPGPNRFGDDPLGQDPEQLRGVFS